MLGPSLRIWKRLEYPPGVGCRRSNYKQLMYHIQANCPPVMNIYKLNLNHDTLQAISLPYSSK